MGGAIPGGIILLVILVLAVVVGGVLVRPWMQERRRVSDLVNAPETPTLDYHAPEEQDPAVVLAALDGEGYVATVDPRDTRRVRVACPDGVEAERERVRSIIRSTRTTLIDAGAALDPGPVRFDDER
jgi:hypothetical protein